MEQLIVAIFLGFFFLDFLVEFSLNELNLQWVRARWANKEIPAYFRDKISAEDYSKSVDYTLAKGTFQRWTDVYGRLITLAVLFSGVLPYLDRFTGEFFQSASWHAYAHGILFCLSVGAGLALTGLPTELYATFGLEARFGFNKMTFKVYLADKLKGLVVGLIIGVPFLFIVLWLMNATGSYWWLWAFLFVSAFQGLMIVLYPTVIAPLFNKFEPLKEGEFRDRILQLAEQVGFKTSGIFTMDGSKRSGHSNAYFTGLGRAKRIVLFDTLIEQMTADQGLAVLAHEMGHSKMKHIRRMLVVQTIFLLAGLYALSLLRQYAPFFAAFGMSQPSNHAALVLFSLVSGPLIFYLAPVMNALSRKHEFEADRFAKSTLGDGQPMAEALVNLTVKNLSNLTPHPWYSAYHYSHPTPTERIAALQRR